jgi:hypothetical protein
MESKRAMQSGARYCGVPISYSSCSLTVWTLTSPPVPGCLVTVNVPSAAASTSGNPRLEKLLTLCQSVKLPPVHWVPHSMMWPATIPAAIRSQSSAAQPNSWIIGASVTPVSVTRPVMTTLAPISRAFTTGAAPR